MNAYLDIAESVLRSERRPLTPRAIMSIAFKAGIVSHQLYGKTQYKTLGARLSEDLVHRSDRSLFFRPAPGKFFLREFLTDTSVPEEYRRPVPTRRRFRELVMGSVLAVDGNALSLFGRDKPIDPAIILDLLQSKKVRYEDPRHPAVGSVYLRAFVCVQRGEQILTYRLGRYREDRDTFIYKRSIGFATLVRDSEHTLFSTDDFGIVDAGVYATKIDLDIPNICEGSNKESRGGRLSHFVWVSEQGGGDLLAVICYECPEWFEPTKRRLALNDVRWLDNLSSVNDVADFDPWSQQILRSAVEAPLRWGTQRAGTNEAYSR